MGVLSPISAYWLRQRRQERNAPVNICSNGRRGPRVRNTTAAQGSTSLAFDTPFKTLKVAEFQKEPEEIRNLIAAISDDQDSLPISKNYSFVCEIETKLISAKKITDSTDLVATVGGAEPGATIVQRTVSNLDKYPLSANELNSEVREKCEDVTKGMVWKAITELGMKDDARYSKYSYRTHKDEATGPTKASGSIYNYDAARALIQYFKRKENDQKTNRGTVAKGVGGVRC